LTVTVTSVSNYVMRPRSSSGWRNKSASVTVTITDCKWQTHPSSCLSYIKLL